MTQDTEQNVRPRDEQIIVIATMLMALAASKAANGDPDAAMETAERHILEAEVRGAAAERERCAKVCEAIIEAIWHEKGSSPEPETGGVSLGETDHEIVVNLEEAAEAIRSAAK